MTAYELKVDGACLVEMGRFALRHIRYGRIAASLVADLDLLGRQTGEDPVSWLLELLATLQEDRRRVLARAVWDEQRLDAHHRSTFGRSLDLLLLAVGSSSRAKDAQVVVEALSVTSVIRDLDEDLARGLCNVPQDIAGVFAAADARAVRKWQHAAGERAQAAIGGPWADRLDPRGRRALAPFVRSMQRWLHAFQERSEGNIAHPG